MRLALAFSLLASTATAQTCGGPLPAFIAGIKAEATSQGIAAADVDRFFQGASIDPKVLQADRSQSVFQRDFIDFSRRLISQNRIDNGRSFGNRYDATFAQIEREYGIPRGVLLAFWAVETDYGQIQGDFNTRNALLTLAHDCRRPELFRPQLIAGIKLMAQGNFDPATTTGAWAGEIGQVQMLPADIIAYGRDGDGDGQVSLKTSAPDALISGANLLANLGWRAGEPWLQEVGPAFLAYPNFEVYFEWNQSFVYVLTAAYFGTRLEGASIYDAGKPSPGLSGDQIQVLQQKLSNRGYDVGGIDGILGAKTREAVQLEQRRLGLPADAWPTAELVNAL